MKVGVISVQLKSAPRERRHMTNDLKVRRHEATRVIEELK